MNLSWRSLLFVAADDRVRLAKVAGRGADAVILDLEDAVPPDRKDAAREGLPEVVETLAGQCPLVVRVNGSWLEMIADLAVATCSGVAAIMIPKVENGMRLHAVAEIVAELSEKAGLAAPPGLIALVESPAGIAEADAIAAVPGVIGLALGTEDFSLALGVPPTPAALELPCRELALAAARYGRMALGLPVSIATIDDEAAWRAAAVKARAIGMTGALCIHPRQLGVANTGFAPTAAEVDNARRVLDAWAEAQGAGVIQLDGRMIDRPVMLAAQRIVDRVVRQP
ncbi:MAG: CoA ester lyase [Sphingomonas sp.]|nr:CoA ester lyase [Sphingomonas sp.]